jgi:threonine/homoserine/homoserine lactone efflux protein
MWMLLAGMFLSLVGSLPPGLISLSVAWTSLSKGVRASLWLAFGAAGTEFFQAIAAARLSNWFLQHPSLSQQAAWATALVLLAAAIYLFFFAKPPGQDAGQRGISGKRLMARGAVLSAFNLLAIPYWFVFVGWMRGSGYWRDGAAQTALFALGVTVGTMAALGLYALLSGHFVRHSNRVSAVANKVIAGIFLLLAIRLMLQG